MDSNHRCILRHGFTVRYLRQLGAPAHDIERFASIPSPFKGSTLSLQDYARCVALCVFFVAFTCIISANRDIAGRL